MDLLRYEFMNAPEGSYNYNVGQLVKKVRYYRENVSIDDFKAAIPELKVLERKLQSFDQEIGLDRREYLEEIMDELKKESEIESQLLEEIERASKAIASALYDTNFSLDDFLFEFRNDDAVYWIEFYGYQNAKKTDGTLLVVKEVFRSVCYKFGIIFIDSSLSDK
jgi:hypothetical protein